MHDDGHERQTPIVAASRSSGLEFYPADHCVPECLPHPESLIAASAAQMLSNVRARTPSGSHLAAAAEASSSPSSCLRIGELSFPAASRAAALFTTAPSGFIENGMYLIV